MTIFVSQTSYTPRELIEASVLMYNIQRLIHESERLKKKEVFEKRARVESQNEKFQELLQRNQKFVGESIFPKYKQTTAHAQLRLLLV